MSAITKLKPDAPEPTGLALLRKPFEAHQISKLPKPFKRDSAKGHCAECGGYHALPAMHLSYVGHAALTDRLLDADPMWTWEPMALDEAGSPGFDRVGGLWIKLTVCGMTRLGYGHAEGKSGGDAIKEVIGDALRNAAMRFGAALDLWHKGDLHAADDDVGEEQGPNAERAAIGILRTYENDADGFKSVWAQNKDNWKKLLDPEAYARVVAVMREIGVRFAKPKPQEDDPFKDEIPF